MKKLFALAASVLLCASAQATVLTFSGSGFVEVPGSIPQSYGDFVSGAGNATYSYGTAGGATPNVAVFYETYAAGAPQLLMYSNAGYGGLSGAATLQEGSGNNYQVRLVATGGNTLSLGSIDLGWATSLTAGGTMDLVVRDEDWNPLFSSTSLSLAHNQSITVNFGGITGDVLIITFAHSSGGGQASDFAFDNLTFSQVGVIPEPGTYAAFAGGFALLGAMAWRRRRASR